MSKCRLDVQNDVLKTYKKALAQTPEQKAKRNEYQKKYRLKLKQKDEPNP